MLTVPQISYVMFRFPKEDLYVCTTCFQLSAITQGWARCACEPAIELDDPTTFDPTVELLCVLCARGRAVPKGQPWRWQGCSCCSKLNGQMKKRMGRGLGMSRISTTNYAVAKRHSANELDLARMNRHIDDWIKEWESIFNWGRMFAEKLWASVPEWADDKYVGVNAWEAKFPRSLENSEQMFLEYAGLTRFGTLENAYAEVDRRVKADVQSKEANT